MLRARQLGKRFSPSSHSVTAFSGQISLSGTQQPMSLTRRQTEGGEMVELRLANRIDLERRGGNENKCSTPTESERLLLKRLILDSPHNFVLAQLRGASYFTVARNVRPINATDGYDGPLWNLVRVDEPQVNESRSALSTWRSYYINVCYGQHRTCCTKGTKRVTECITIGLSRL